MISNTVQIIEATKYVDLSGVGGDGIHNDWAKNQPSAANYQTFLEGPAFDSAGHLLCVDIVNGRIIQVDDERVPTVLIQYDGWPNGLAIHKDGRVFVADNRYGIMAFDPQSKKITPILTTYQGRAFKGVNDLTFDVWGNLYFTDQGTTGLHDPTGRLFRLSKEGSCDCLLDNIPSPNGLVVAEGGSVIYLAVTRANAVWRVPFTPDGRVVKVGNYVQTSGGWGPDGLALLKDGGLAIVHNGLGAVWLTDPFGSITTAVRCPEGRLVTNVAFGGTGCQTMYITEVTTNSIWAAEVGREGEPIFSSL